MTTKHCCEFSAAFQGLTDKLADQSKLVRLNQEHVSKQQARIEALESALRDAKEAFTEMGIPPYHDSDLKSLVSWLNHRAVKMAFRIDAVLAAQEGKP